MASYKKVTVKKVIKRFDDLIKVIVEADGVEAQAVAYPRLTGDLKTGDEVIVNTTAGELVLGTGGFHIVVWNLKNGDMVIPVSGHIIKMRYSPLQHNVLAVEEKDSPVRDKLAGYVDLQGLPVIIGTLHSQLSPAVAVLKKLTSMKTRVAYIMTDRAALPMALSDQVRELKNKGLLDTTVTVGQAFGGDLEAVNVFSGLAAAKVVAGADVAIVTMGIGVVGTDTYLGFSGMEQGEIANAAFAMRGRPIAIPRIMFGDKRSRHRGLSQQTVAALTVAALVTCDVPIPHMNPEHAIEVMDKLDKTGLTGKHRVKIVASDETEEALTHFDLHPTTMGRGFTEEPEFFRAAGAAGYLAAQIVRAKKR